MLSSVPTKMVVLAVAAEAICKDATKTKVTRMKLKW